RVSGGACASSGRDTIGASTPSKSRKMPVSAGADDSRSSNASAVAATALSIGALTMDLVRLILIGLAAGFFSALFGVGGGIVFVPTLTALGLTQLHAEASSLLAIIPTVAVGVWRQQSYGNVRWRAALVIGIASIGAAVGGAQVAVSLPEATLRKL